LRKAAEELARRIAYQFKYPAYLKTALTHRSATKKNNERLEFLGDSVLSLVISEYLYAHQDKASEGELSRLRSSLVKGDKLAELAQQLQLGDYLILGSGELKSGGFRRSSILADTLEAIFGAVFLDSDYVTCKKMILDLYQHELSSLPEASSVKDNKTRLQEYMQSRQLPLPVYDVIDISGEAHAQTFTVECSVVLLDAPVKGEGKSRRKAEQQAAENALNSLTNE
jgi:ribonuclease-3